MVYERDVTLDLLNKLDDGSYHGLLQVKEGAYDVYGTTIAEFIEEGKNLADFLGVTINTFNTDPENLNR